MIPRNEKLILKAIIKAGKASNTIELAKITGLTRQHVSTMINFLRKKHLVYIESAERCKGGKRNNYWLDTKGGTEFLFNKFKLAHQLSAWQIAEGIGWEKDYTAEICKNLEEEGLILWLKEEECYKILPQYAIVAEKTEEVRFLDDNFARIIANIWDSAVKHAVNLNRSYQNGLY